MADRPSKQKKKHNASDVSKNLIFGNTVKIVGDDNRKFSKLFGKLK